MAQEISFEHEPSPDRRQVVLVVEDEVLVRTVAAAYLRDEGFVVLEAAHAAEAMRILDVEASVDLVFSDIDMPGTIDGFALAEQIGHHRPRVRVLLTSGAGGTIMARADADVRFLPKPYRLDELLRQIRGLLEG